MTSILLNRFAQAFHRGVRELTGPAGSSSARPVSIMGHLRFVEDGAGRGGDTQGAYDLVA